MTERADLVSSYPLPAMRKLRVYAFDPQASVELVTAVINDATIELPWETRWETPLKRGPTNEYVEVVDIDPASGVFYEPLDPTHPTLLAQNGLAPSEGRPQFHQQMVFAVAMRTIRAFERALGRPVLWAGDRGAASGTLERSFTRTLRIYPHALRDENAYYSPEKRALLFGYFRSRAAGQGDTANWVFTCLSQDIVAHETTHAILHGLQQRSIEASNPDSLAFHEAFADIVALLQHFSIGEVLRQLLAQSRGSLRGFNLLTGLAAQFGRETGRKGALRYAIDMLTSQASTDERHDPAKPADDATTPSKTPPKTSEPDGKKKRDDDDDDEKPSLATTYEAHARGGYLVAAVFDAFVTIYERRTADLFRLAGLAPGSVGADGALPHELVARLATEASKAADHVLRMCVRALDYMPPVDVRFGEYLRAIVTADTDLVPNDPLRYRVAFVEAFKKRDIRVPGCISMAPDSLVWEAPDLSDYPRLGTATGGGIDPVSAAFADLLKSLQLAVAFDGRQSWAGEAESGPASGEQAFNGNLRDLAMRIVRVNQATIHDWFDADSSNDEDWERLVGMRLLSPTHRFRSKDAKPMGSITTKKDRITKESTDTPLFEVHSARISRRAGPDGQELPQLIVQMTQRRRAYFDPEEQEAAERNDYGKIGEMRRDTPDFWFRGGATIHVDLRDGRLLRIIRKRIDNDDRLADEKRFRLGDVTGLAMTGERRRGGEPFAFLHRSAQ